MVGPYICHGYIALSPTRNGILYPIYRRGAVNASFVQESDKDGKIGAFIAFYDFDEFSYVPALTPGSRNVGDDTLFAYINHNGLLVEITYADAQRMGREEPELFENTELPILTRLALARLSNAPQLIQMDRVREFGDRFLRTARARDAFRSTYSKLIDERRWIWERIESGGAEHQDDKTALLEPFVGLDVEELFRWLFEYRYDRQWVAGFARLLRRVGFDERVLDLIGRMLTDVDFDWSTASAIEKSIIARGIETYLARNESHNDFEDVMNDFILSGEIFDLANVAGVGLLFEFIDLLDSRLRLSSPVIDVYIDGLQRPDLSTELAVYLVSQILNSPHLDLPYPRGPDEISDPPTREDRFRIILKESGRLSLVLSRQDLAYVKGELGPRGLG